MSTTFRRSQYAGRTDVYAPRVSNSPALQALDDGTSGTAPRFVLGPVITDTYLQNADRRLAAYADHWKFYSGDLSPVPYDGSLKRVSINFIKKIINKRASWAVGKGMCFESRAGNEYVSEMLLRVWNSSNDRVLLRSCVRTALITGDAFLYFNVVKVDVNGKQLPKNKWYIRILQLNPAYCFPQYNEADPTQLSSILIRFQAMLPDTDQAGKATGSKSEHTFSRIIYPDSIVDSVDDQQVSEVPNPAGIINMVHMRNESEVDSVFGNSIVPELADVNVAYNDIFHSVRRICAYHGEPTTIVYGARLQEMERSASKVWSGLPIEARVENLVVGGELAPMKLVLDATEAQLYHLGQTPKICFDSDGLAISNTSGIAMALLFQPLIEATCSAQDFLSAAVAKGNEIIVRLHEAVLGDNIKGMADEPENMLDIEVSFESMLPKDVQMELDMALKKREAGIISRAELIRKHSGVRDLTRNAIELAADAREELAHNANTARALNGQPTNPAAVFLGSPFLSEDMVDIATKLPASSPETA